MIIFIPRTENSLQIHCNHNTATLFAGCDKLEEFKFNDEKELKKQIKIYCKDILKHKINIMQYLYKNKKRSFICRIEQRSQNFSEFCNSFTDFTDWKKLLSYANSNDTNF